MKPFFYEMALPVILGAGLTTGLVLIGVIYAKLRNKKSAKSGFWEAVTNAGGKAPSLRDKTIFSVAAMLLSIILLLALYAWTIGFGGYAGRVEKITVTSLGKYGDYALQVNGKIHRVGRDVYQAAKEGSTVSRPWGRPYLVLDGEHHIKVWALGFLGAVGILVIYLCLLIFILVWWPIREECSSQ